MLAERRGPGGMLFYRVDWIRLAETLNLEFRLQTKGYDKFPDKGMQPGFRIGGAIQFPDKGVQSDSGQGVESGFLTGGCEPFTRVRQEPHQEITTNETAREKIDKPSRERAWLSQKHTAREGRTILNENRGFAMMGRVCAAMDQYGTDKPWEETTKAVCDALSLNEENAEPWLVQAFVDLTGKKPESA